MINFKRFLLMEYAPAGADSQDSSRSNETPQEAAAAAKKRAILKQRNPRQVYQMDRKTAADNAAEARKSDGPTKTLDIQIANLEQQLAGLRQRRAQVKR